MSLKILPLVFTMLFLAACTAKSPVEEISTESVILSESADDNLSESSILAETVQETSWETGMRLPQKP